MSKKDYIAIARILKNSETLEEVRLRLVVLFKENNPRFDPERFLKAARPDERKNSSP